MKFSSAPCKTPKCWEIRAQRWICQTLGASFVFYHPSIHLLPRRKVEVHRSCRDVKLSTDITWMCTYSSIIQLAWPANSTQFVSSQPPTSAWSRYLSASGLIFLHVEGLPVRKSESPATRSDACFVFPTCLSPRFHSAPSVTQMAALVGRKG